jgi:hypothetical protein
MACTTKDVGNNGDILWCGESLRWRIRIVDFRNRRRCRNVVTIMTMGYLPLSAFEFITTCASTLSCGLCLWLVVRRDLLVDHTSVDW